MSVTVDGHKLFVVTDQLGRTHSVAGMQHADVHVRATKRGITPTSIKWHPWYREFAAQDDVFERNKIATKIEDAIWNDVVTD